MSLTSLCNKSFLSVKGKLPHSGMYTGHYRFACKAEL